VLTFVRVVANVCRLDATSENKLRILTLAIVVVLAGCTSTAGEEDAMNVDIDVSNDGMVDVTMDTTPADLDAQPETDGHTETGLDLLYWGLTDETLVGAALRGAACIDGASVPGILDDAARGFVYGEVLLSGYAGFTYGN